MSLFALIHFLLHWHRAVEPTWHCIDFGECVRICSRCGDEC